MRIQERNVYKFEELSPEIQEKVLDKLRDINTDYDWWDDDYLLDPTDPELKQMKVRLPKDYKSPIFSWKDIIFDLDRNQHLEFVDLTVNDENAFRLLLGVDKRLFEKMYCSFGHDSYHRYPTTNLIIEPNEGLYDFTAREIKIIERAIERFSDMIHNAWKRLRADYEYYVSDEAIKETILANEYEFTANGEMI